MCRSARPYAQGSNPRLAGLPDTSATHTCEPRLGQAAPPEGPELRWTAAAPVESGSPPAPRAATEGDAAPSPSPSPSPRPSPAPPQPAAESTYNLGRQSTPIATLPYLDARFASLPLALAPLLIPLWLLGSSAYFQPRQARRARPGAGQPHAAWSQGGYRGFETFLRTRIEMTKHWPLLAGAIMAGDWNFLSPGDSPRDLKSGLPKFVAHDAPPDAKRLHPLLGLCIEIVGSRGDALQCCV